MNILHDFVDQENTSFFFPLPPVELSGEIGFNRGEATKNSTYTLDNILESIVAGVCMTLAGKKTNRKDDSEESEWILPGESGVTDPAKVFEVQGISLVGNVNIHIL